MCKKNVEFFSFLFIIYLYLINLIDKIDSVDFFYRPKREKRKETFRFKYRPTHDKRNDLWFRNLATRHSQSFWRRSDVKRGETLPKLRNLTQSWTRTYTLTFLFSQPHPLFDGPRRLRSFWIRQTSTFTLVNASAVGWFILFTLPRQSLAGRDSKRPIRNGGARNRSSYVILPYPARE